MFGGPSYIAVRTTGSVQWRRTYNTSKKNTDSRYLVRTLIPPSCCSLIHTQRFVGKVNWRGATTTIFLFLIFSIQGSFISLLVPPCQILVYQFIVVLNTPPNIFFGCSLKASRDKNLFGIMKFAVVKRKKFFGRFAKPAKLHQIVFKNSSWLPESRHFLDGWQYRIEFCHNSNRRLLNVFSFITL